MLHSRLDLFLDPAWDPAVLIDGTSIDRILQIVDECGGPKEGDIFSCSSAQLRRRVYSFFVAASGRILEIGFNRGLSTLLGLSINPKASYVNLDLCLHSYVIPIHCYLRKAYDDRLRLIEGDSLVTFPLLMEEPRFDLYVIDGGHGIRPLYHDLSNVCQHGGKGSVVYVDDMEMDEVRIVTDYFASSRMIRPIYLNSASLTANEVGVFEIC